MSLSLFDLFKIGIGPSSSHTVGPMWAAQRFARELQTQQLLAGAHRIRISLYGSLALTGKGHATDIAVLLGLCGESPDQIDPDSIPAIIDEIRAQQVLALAGEKNIPFRETQDLCFLQGESLPQHPNGMLFQLFDRDETLQIEKRYFSVGGGFVLCEDEIGGRAAGNKPPPSPYPFETAAELLSRCSEASLSIGELVMANERALRSEQEIEQGIAHIWQVMQQAMERGFEQRGELPGGLGIRRRAHALHKELVARGDDSMGDQLAVMDWINLFAMAVNEENAAGGRVVTAPTNGAAGVIPAVLAYQQRFVPGARPDDIQTFFATAAAIGMLYKKNASLSAAEVGCQGEVGVACSMAAAGLTAVMGGSNAQIENAAEIGMEHNLGLTCDPINGLVQVPCIERNTMGAIKAVNASRLALRGDGIHRVSLDSVIETMRQTGADMQEKYKETSLGGLAVNVVAC